MKGEERRGEEEYLGITQGDKDDSMVGENSEGSESSGLNATMLAGCAHKQSSKLSVKCAFTNY